MKSVFYFTLGLSVFLSVGRPSLASEPAIIKKDEFLRLVVDINNAIKNGDFALLSAYMPARLL
ncbi:hypothetical protein HNQ69_001627 [Bartonella callosciuri]|uniref:Chorismate mutase n=1 Tax=Bartonella callosciuri TaxID=686223 RepID=A0A840NNZ5_9HYPH|nr:hypothetical protein [Bartonella callosciuri]